MIEALLTVYIIIGALFAYLYSLLFIADLFNKHSYLEGLALIVAWPLTAVILFIKYLYRGIVKLFNE